MPISVKNDNSIITKSAEHSSSADFIIAMLPHPCKKSSDGPDNQQYNQISRINKPPKHPYKDEEPYHRHNTQNPYIRIGNVYRQSLINGYQFPNNDHHQRNSAQALQPKIAWCKSQCEPKQFVISPKQTNQGYQQQRPNNRFVGMQD
jgi:hypothetical protein